MLPPGVLPDASPRCCPLLLPLVFLLGATPGVAPSFCSVLLPPGVAPWCCPLYYPLVLPGDAAPGADPTLTSRCCAGGAARELLLPSDVDVILLCFDISRPEALEGITRRVSAPSPRQSRDQAE